MKERVSFVHEYLTKSPYFFERPREYELASSEKNWKSETPSQITKLRDRFNALQNPTKEDYENALKQIAAELNIGVGKLIHPLRLAVSGKGTGPGVYDILVILGKDEVTERIHSAVEKIR